MKPGFSLLEVVIALFMAALIGLSLFQLLNVTRKSVGRITNIIELDVPFLAFYNQLEKDILGMFTPRSSLGMYVQKMQEKEKKSGEKSEKKEEKKQASQGISPVFSMEAKKDSFFLSFITTGAVTILDRDGSLLPMPSTRRVAYMLVPDPQRPGSLRLMYRFSLKELSAQALKKQDFSPSYELISGIRQLEIECTLIEYVQKEESQEKAPKGKEQTKSEPAPKKESTTVIKEWNEEDIWSKYKSLIPAYVRLKGVVVDRVGTEYPFDFMFKVMSYNPYVPKKQKKQNIFERLSDIAGQIFKGP